MAKYDASQIVALDPMTAIRVRLGMYVGSTATPNHIITEIVSNSIDEISAGYGESVVVSINKNGSVTVEDNGRGIPFDRHAKLNMSALDAVFLMTHTGGKMENTTGYKTSIGLNGIGVKCATATCEKMTVEVWRDNKHVTRVYSRGKTVGDMKIENYTGDRRGTSITYHPDPTKGIWDTTEFDIPAIKSTMKGFSYFFPKAKLIFIDNRGKKPVETVYHSPNGLLDMYKDIAGTEDLVTKEPIRIMSELDGIEDGLDIVFGYTHSYYDRSVGYCNALRLSEGGTHMQGFKAALTKSLNDAARTLQILKPKDMNFKGQELSDGLVAIVSVKLSSPKFENQTKTKLSNMDLVGKVNSIAYDYLKNYFEDNPKVVLNICDKLLKMRKAREAAKKARELVLNDNKNKSEFSNSLVGKLATCSSRDPEKNEVLLVEGSSAAGNMKQARDSKIQAVYALRGKVLNVEKVDMSVAFKNQEIKDLISILGCGINEDFDMNKLKYGKVIIATDSDTDGSHIRLLLLTFFFRYMPELVKSGRICAIVAPLFKILYNNTYEYAMTNEERDKIINRIKNKYKYTVLRYKGLMA